MTVFVWSENGFYEGSNNVNGDNRKWHNDNLILKHTLVASPYRPC